MYLVGFIISNIIAVSKRMPTMFEVIFKMCAFFCLLESVLSGIFNIVVII